LTLDLACAVYLFHKNSHRGNFQRHQIVAFYECLHLLTHESLVDIIPQVPTGPLERVHIATDTNLLILQPLLDHTIKTMD
jgi:hypothetical protein